MNLKNSFGKFGALVVNVITFVKESLTNVSDDFMEWLGTDCGRSALRSAVETAVKSLVGEYEDSISPLTSTKVKVEHVIDFDSAPVCPPGLTVAPESDQITSRVRGKRSLNKISVRLHLNDGQKGGKWIRGYNLKSKLEGQEVFGAQLLDFYLEHTDLIPEEWKTKGAIFFWGTIYRGSGGYLFVRYLIWDGTRWLSGSDRRVVDGWDGRNPAAVSASTQG